MFGNLVESNSHRGDTARKGWFFLGTLGVYAVIFLAIGVGSIYAYNTHVEAQNLELVSMITPVESSEVQPAPRPLAARREAGGGSNEQRVAVVRETPVTTVMDPNRVENEAMVSPPAPELPPGTKFRVGTPGPNDNIFGNAGNKPGGGPPGGRGTGPGTAELEEMAKAAPPPPVVVKKVVKPPTTVSKGVINSMAIQLPKPVYSAIAKAARAAGVVQVQVLIDEQGKVVSARALSGHQLLLRESVQAAYQARFTPTYLSDQPVKVSGVITYNFVMQ
ncbi:MAG TPA: TonB family protein [Pyrinomonadaceae bacterium]|nr:TonB family protein [Pyrinomonadaceae bacterium]